MLSDDEVEAMTARSWKEIHLKRLAHETVVRTILFDKGLTTREEFETLEAAALCGLEQLQSELDERVAAKEGDKA